MPDSVAAWALLLFIAAVTVRHPANGLCALVLALPFLLGEPKTVFFLLEPALVALVLLSFAGHRLLGRIAHRAGPGLRRFSGSWPRPSWPCRWTCGTSWKTSGWSGRSTGR